jgi:hypothetical protein
MANSQWPDHFYDKASSAKVGSNIFKVEGP